MTQCPKCGSSDISRPTYGRTIWGVERLFYVCLRCYCRAGSPPIDQVKE